MMITRLKYKDHKIMNNLEMDLSKNDGTGYKKIVFLGENGVGKEIFPRVIHDYSLRKGKRYFAVNCGSIPEGTIDSELFGHEKGAFTGAVEAREGYFGASNGGTLFLD